MVHIIGALTNPANGRTPMTRTSTGPEKHLTIRKYTAKVLPPLSDFRTTRQETDQETLTSPSPSPPPSISTSMTGTETPETASSPRPRHFSFHLPLTPVQLLFHSRTVIPAAPLSPTAWRSATK